jgi:hypothetical protein
MHLGPVSQKALHFRNTRPRASQPEGPICLPLPEIATLTLHARMSGVTVPRTIFAICSTSREASQFAQDVIRPNDRRYTGARLYCPLSKGQREPIRRSGLRTPMAGIIPCISDLQSLGNGNHGTPGSDLPRWVRGTTPLTLLGLDFPRFRTA